MYLCRKPTLETVILLLDLFGGGLAEFYMRVRGEEVDREAALQQFLATMTARRDDAAAVLATCVEGPGGPARTVAELAASADLVLGCAGAVLRQVDARAVLAELPLEEMFARAEADTDAGVEEPPGLEEDQMTPMLAKVFGASPAEIARWPYDAYLSAVKTVGGGAGDPAASPEELGKLPGIDVVH